jgi:hypothetical protein
MGRVVTNFLTLARFAREATLGVLPGAPQWFELEPNSINNFGNTIGTTARSPISKVRARRKGVVTDLDSGGRVRGRSDAGCLRDFIECFCFARAVGPDSYMTSAVAAGGYTVPAVSAAQSGRLIYSGGGAKSLLYARGFDTRPTMASRCSAAAVAPGAPRSRRPVWPPRPRRPPCWPRSRSRACAPRSATWRSTPAAT